MSDLRVQKNKSTLNTRIFARVLSAFLIMLSAPEAHTLPDFMSGRATAPQQQIQVQQPTAIRPSLSREATEQQLQIRTAPVRKTFSVTEAPLRAPERAPEPAATTYNKIRPAEAVSPTPRAPEQPSFQAQNRQAASGGAPVYRLGAGDKLRLIVFGEEELSAEYELDGSGNLSLPLIGQVRAGGQTVQNLESQITRQYADGYLINPRISLEVINFRPFYIVGEVNNPGNYPYINGLTVLNAVAVAGGYSPRAKKDKIELKRIYNGQEQTQIVGEATPVLPGDVIEVKERFF